MSDRDQDVVRLARIRDATEALSPPADLLARIEGEIGRRVRKPAPWLLIAGRARALAIGALVVGALALLVGWRAEEAFEEALGQSLYVLMEVLS